MGSDLLSLFLNIIIAVLLLATIFYVYRLTKSLDNFKEHRRELDSVIANLLSSIDQANDSVKILKRTSAQEADELERLIAQARALSDELKIINDAGESMAKRLENLAETNRKIVQPEKNSISSYVSGYGGKSKKISSAVNKKGGTRRTIEKTSSKKRKEDYRSTLRHVDVNNDKGMEDFPSFMIHDRDIDIENISNKNTIEKNGDYIEHNSSDNEFQSQAERDLLEALRASKQNITKGDI